MDNRSIYLNKGHLYISMPHFPHRVLRHGLFGAAAANALLATTNMVQRYRDSVRGEDGFSQHTRKEHKANLITVFGCNRQVSKHGQTNWMNPFPGIHIQYGAGGGGLTRAPDFAVNDEQQHASSPANRR